MPSKQHRLGSIFYGGNWIAGFFSGGFKLRKINSNGCFPGRCDVFSREMSVCVFGVTIF